MGNFPCATEDSCFEQPVAVNMLFIFSLITFGLPVGLGIYNRFFTEEGRKLAAKKKREKDARKDSRKVSIEVGQSRA